MTGLSVAILAGGMSRRMGRDKALLEINGRTLLEITAERAASVGDELFVVASRRDEYVRLGFSVVPDVFPHAGSLGGIYTAVAHARNEYCLVVACDMPLLNPRLLRVMARHDRTFDALIPSLPRERSDQGDDETLETLHAIYGRSVLPFFERQIRGGKLKIADALRDIRLERIGIDEILAVDPTLSSFFNVNTPEDLESAHLALSQEP